MDERVKELEEELKPKIVLRFSRENHQKPLKRFAHLAYYTATPASERSEEKSNAYIFESAEVDKLIKKQPLAHRGIKIMHNKLIRSHNGVYKSSLALEEMMTSGRFFERKNYFLGRDEREDTGQRNIQLNFYAKIVEL
jgi:hypothetical protein